MSADLQFSERQVLIGLVNNELLLALEDKIYDNRYASGPEEYSKILQSCMDKLGGNVELNKKRYEEENKK